MAKQKIGIKEVANVILFDVKTGKPALFFDTLKVSSIENEAEEAKAEGGQGKNNLVSWDYGRTANLTMQDALLSEASLAALAGTELEEGAGIRIVQREELNLVAGDKLSKTPIEGTLYVYAMEDGVMGAEIEDFTELAGEITATGQDEVVAFYEYESADGEAVSRVRFTGKDFPSVYRVVGDTIVRNQDGVDERMQFVIQKAKLKSSFSLTMDVENVSTFDFNLEVLTDNRDKNKGLYDIIRIG